jgi:serine phosphatase RsbU (regulator of sigma subunit)
VMKALHQTGDRVGTKDSIDIGLCIIDCDTGRMQFAGANRPLIMVRDGELREFRPDKMTIGVAPLLEAPFNNNIIETIPGDSFYLFSDGFSDQFGGKDEKKFKHRRFREMIESVESLSMKKQKEIIERTFNEWKGEVPQVDDILVFGFRV